MSVEYCRSNQKSEIKYEGFGGGPYVGGGPGPGPPLNPALHSTEIVQLYSMMQVNSC